MQKDLIGTNKFDTFEYLFQSLIVCDRIINIS